jgi:hypothetical protein
LVFTALVSTSLIAFTGDRKLVLAQLYVMFAFFSVQYRSQPKTLIGIAAFLFAAALLYPDMDKFVEDSHGACPLVVSLSDELKKESSSIVAALAALSRFANDCSAGFWTDECGFAIFFAFKHGRSASAAMPNFVKRESVFAKAEVKVSFDRNVARVFTVKDVYNPPQGVTSTEVAIYISEAVFERKRDEFALHENAGTGYFYASTIAGFVSTWSTSVLSALSVYRSAIMEQQARVHGNDVTERFVSHAGMLAMGFKTMCTKWMAPPNLAQELSVYACDIGRYCKYGVQPDLSEIRAAMGNVARVQVSKNVSVRARNASSGGHNNSLNSVHPVCFEAAAGSRLVSFLADTNLSPDDLELAGTFIRLFNMNENVSQQEFMDSYDELLAAGVDHAHIKALLFKQFPDLWNVLESKLNTNGNECPNFTKEKVPVFESKWAFAAYGSVIGGLAAACSKTVFMVASTAATIANTATAAAGSAAPAGSAAITIMTSLVQLARQRRY